MQILGLIYGRIQLVGGLDIIGGDKRKVGYYVGLTVSFATDLGGGYALFSDGSRTI